ncbi:MarR family winged helix-turn-helix transcriptional regulator [Amphritea balenae]|uniref:MarR family transcriptional regulator n=1 Tax=Amphritea balenae TaxID=452629 RepID=A0A3P1SLA9_9GAMM|nr:MarR family transcriptional regulator [Amphritea balenae]RRC98031.1 MarR family transcriptional regulator [Amphritea balenae]GGK66981.1 MarR family transcriptional regulator [Amphritea balenae]
MKRTTGNTIIHGHLPQLLGYQLRLTQLAVFKDFSDSVSDADITPSLFAVLVVIDANPGLKQTELAKAVHLDRSTVVSAIDKLERRNLVQRKRVAGDRRTNALQLTNAGSTLLAQLTLEVSEHERQIAAQLTQTERETLIQLLSKVSPESR